MNLSYFTVITDKNMTESVKKSFLERLTWKFWVTHKTIQRKDMIVIQDDKIIVCHPSLEKAIEDEIERLI